MSDKVWIPCRFFPKLKVLDICPEDKVAIVKVFVRLRNNRILKLKTFELTSKDIDKTFNLNMLDIRLHKSLIFVIELMPEKTVPYWLFLRYIRRRSVYIIPLSDMIKKKRYVLCHNAYILPFISRGGMCVLLLEREMIC